MEGKNHRIGKADSADMVRKRDLFLKNFREHLAQKILSGIARKGGREAPGRIMWSFVYHVLVPKFGTSTSCSNWGGGGNLGNGRKKTFWRLVFPLCVTPV